MIHERNPDGGAPSGGGGGFGRRPEVGDLRNRARQLAARGPSPWPVLSAYVNLLTPAGEPAPYRPVLKRELAAALATLPDPSPERESLQIDATRVQNYLDYELTAPAQAVALFANFAESDMFEAFPLPVRFPADAVRVGPLPWLFPLLGVLDRSRRAVALVVETDAARLYALALGRIELRREVRAPRPALAGLAVAALEDLARETDATWLYASSDAATRAEVEAAFSPAGAPHLLAPVIAWDQRPSEEDVVWHVEELVATREAKARVVLAERLAAPMHGGRTVRGLEDALAALTRGTVSELVLSAAFPDTAPGWTCLSCRAFGEGDPPAACPACGRATTLAVPLREELGHRALALGARVRFVERGASPAFDAEGGIGAVLKTP